MLGWLLGVLSPVITHGIMASRKTDEFRRGLRAELEEFAARVIPIVHLMANHHGVLDKDLFEWLYQHEKRYRGAHPIGSVGEIYDKARALPEEQIKELNRHFREKQKGKGSSVKKQHLPYLQSHLGSLSSLSEAEQ